MTMSRRLIAAVAVCLAGSVLANAAVTRADLERALASDLDGWLWRLGEEEGAEAALHLTVAPLEPMLFSLSLEDTR